MAIPNDKPKTLADVLAIVAAADLAPTRRNGFLFVTEKGSRKSQQTLSQQITEAIAEHVGVHMTPHQFRHLAATIYLDTNPEDQQTVQAMLHHASSKTTLIYAGSASRRASRAYGNFLFQQREKLKLNRIHKKKRPRTSTTVTNDALSEVSS